MGYLGFVIALVAVLGALFLAARWGGKSGMAIYSAGTLLLTLTFAGSLGFDIVFAEGLSMLGILIGAFLLSMIIYFLKYGTKAGIKFGFKVGGVVIVYAILVFAFFVAEGFGTNWFEMLHAPIALIALIVTSTVALFGMLQLINKNKLKGILAFILLALVAVICTIFFYLILGVLGGELTAQLTACGISAIIAVVEMVLGYLVYLLATYGKKEVLPAKPYSAPKTEAKKEAVKTAPKATPVKKETTKKPVVAKKVEPAKKPATKKPAQKAKKVSKPVAKKSKK